MTPEQQAAEVLAAHEIGLFALCACGYEPARDVHGYIISERDWRHAHIAAALAAAGVLATDTDDTQAVARVRALLVSPNIAPCERHGYGPNAAIHSNCDWCASFGMDQEWRDDLTAAIDGDQPRQDTRETGAGT